MHEQRPRVAIAVVDDDMSVRKALERLLRVTGFDVATFASGEEFYFSLESLRPDCLVLDLHMPGMSGLDVLRRLDQAGFQVPVIVISGDAEPQTRAQCLSAGATDYLRKPFDDEALLSAIQHAMAPAHGG
jgi:FixJ family two-component response regulator